MNLSEKIISPTLHRIAKIDAGESVTNYSPLRTKVLPIAGLGLGLAAMGYNYQQAADEEARKKVLIRDGLVVAGVAVSSIAASYLVNRTSIAKKIAEQVKNAGEKLVATFKSKRALADGIKTAAHQHTHCTHGHGHHHSAFPQKAEKMLGALFQSDKHSHGGEAAVALTLLSAIPIFLGGVPAGALGDWLNKEDWRQTLPMKLKEGTFQFLGNITVCTVAILGFSTLGKKLAQKLWKMEGVRKFTQNKTQQYLQQLAESPKGNLALVPTKLTQDVEHILLEHRGKPTEIAQALKKYFKGFENDWDRLYQDKLSPLLNRKTVDRAKVHAEIREFIEPKLRDALKECEAKPQSIETLARLRFNSMADTMGVLAGVFSGVVGGAWISNKVNEAATQVFNWPKGHVTSGLFQHTHNHSHGAKGKEANPDGWLAGKVGERGIHWYDGILHLDDIPSALYIGGMHAVESMIQLLYGISGFLAGTAGINYAQAKKPQNQKATSIPAHRHPGFQHPYQAPQQTLYHFHGLPQQANRGFFG
jgi:hypothetical protein